MVPGAGNTAVCEPDPDPPFIKIIVKYLNSEPMLALLVNQVSLGLGLIIWFPKRARTGFREWVKQKQTETSSGSPPGGKMSWQVNTMASLQLHSNDT